MIEGMFEDDRAQSQVLGAILIFALVISLVAINQAFVVPQQNEEIEFKHSQSVQSDFIGFRGAVINSVADGEKRTTELNLGPSYPARQLALNPGEPAGTLQTVEFSEQISSADSFSVEAACGFNDDPGVDNVPTSRLTYKNDYSIYQQSPRVSYENGLSFSEYDSQQVVESGQIFIRGNTITLIPLSGSVSKSTTKTVSTDVIPGETGRVFVTDSDTDSNPDDQVIITLPTQISAERWANLLTGEPYVEATVAPDSSRYDVNGDGETGSASPPDPGEVRFILENPSDAGVPNSRYEVRCTPVGVGSPPPANNPAQEDPDNNDDDDVNEGPNPVNDKEVILKGATIVDKSNYDTNAKCGGNNIQCRADIEFKNDRSFEVTIKQARYVYYGPVNQGSTASATLPPAIKLQDKSYSLFEAAQTGPGFTIQAGDTATIPLYVYNQLPSSGYNIDEGDFIVVRITWSEVGGDSTEFTATYFIPPEETTGGP